MHDPYEAFRYVAFSRFAVSDVLAIVGSQVLSATVQWDVHQRTKDPFAIGMVGLINVIPVILLVLPAGHVADRLSRKRVLLITQVPLMAAPLMFSELNAWNPRGVSLRVTFSLRGVNALDSVRRCKRRSPNRCTRPASVTGAARTARRG